MSYATKKNAVTETVVIEPAEITLVLTQDEANLLAALLGRSMTVDFGGTPEYSRIYQSLAPHTSEASWHWDIKNDDGVNIPSYKAVKR